MEKLRFLVMGQRSNIWAWEWVYEGKSWEASRRVWGTNGPMLWKDLLGVHWHHWNVGGNSVKDTDSEPGVRFRKRENAVNDAMKRYGRRSIPMERRTESGLEVAMSGKETTTPLPGWAVRGQCMKRGDSPPWEGCKRTSVLQEESSFS